MWKKIAESTDLISFEKRAKSLTTRLEARLNSDNTWVIFKKYFNEEGISYTEEYHARNRDEAHYLIDALKDKVLDRSQVEKARLSQKKGIKVRVRRSFKEFNMEKWELSVDGDEYQNFCYLIFEDKISLDIVIHAKYKIWESQIIQELISILGLSNPDYDLVASVMFYQESYKKTLKGRKTELFMGRIEMGIPDDDRN